MWGQLLTVENQETRQLQREEPGALASEKTSNVTALGINTVVYIRTILFQIKILKSG